MNLNRVAVALIGMPTGIALCDDFAGKG